MRRDRDKTAADLETEIRQGRTFNPAEAIGRLAGPGAMKGASPVSRQQQAENEIGSWLQSPPHGRDGRFADSDSSPPERV